MNNAVIIGYGTVGRATGKAFGIEEYYSRTHKNIELIGIAKKEFIFICLPTPTIEGRNYVDDIIKFISDVQAIVESSKFAQPIYVIRSTVYPGFNKFLQKRFGIRLFVSNPEFLSEDTAEEDAKHPDLIVIGSESLEAGSRVEAIYKGRFKYTQFVVTDSSTAELIKYTLNTFFATKVMFGNAIYDFAQTVEANYETIKGVLEYHKWGSKNHFKPFYKNRRGLYGKCLPKDLQAFSVLTNATVLTGVMVSDMLLKEKEKKTHA